jgi:prolyl oligopeptidase
MKKNTKMIVFCLVLGLFIFVSTGAQEPPIKYPVTKKVDQVDDYFGTKVEDPYRWLEEMNSPETRQWINAQVEVTEKYLSSIEFRPRLKARFTELWNYEKYSRPSKEGEYYVFSKNDGLQEQDVVYMQKGPEGKPEVLLDPNTFSKDGSVSLAGMSFSKDNKYLSYGISRGGSDWRSYSMGEIFHLLLVQGRFFLQPLQ